MTRPVAAGLVIGLLWAAAPKVLAQVETAEMAQVDKDLGVVAAELERLRLQHQEIPDLLSVGDRDDRVTWGSIYHLSKEYTRASFLLYSVVEPRAGESPADVESRPGYAESLYYLADSLFELGNVAAARGYFERLLRLPGHPFHDDAVLHLIQLGIDENRHDDVDRTYNDYVAMVGNNVPGQVHYLRGKGLATAKRYGDAAASLGRVPSGEAFDLRARYLRGAIFTQENKLDEALALFTEITNLKPVAREDKEVIELSHVARGRLLYELDRLGESIDAYQAIEYDSRFLTTMLYEVTLTYVRRGQLTLRGSKDDNLTDAERRQRAKVEYEKALGQLADLRALEPDSDNSADVDLLSANLRLQRQEFEKAEAILRQVLTTYRDADGKLAQLLADQSQRERVLQDFLAIGSGGLTVDTKLPPVAARRAANNADVAAALSAFKDIQQTRADVADAAKLLSVLQELLSPDNPGRSELFGPLQGGIERSTSLSNTLVNMRTRLAAVERRAARPLPQARDALAALQARRGELEKRLATLPKTPEAISVRRKRLREQIDAADRGIHELELINRHLHAGLVALDYTIARAGSDRPTSIELQRGRVRELHVEISRNQEAITALKEQVAQHRRDVQTAGGRGSGEDRLRQEYELSFMEERQLLAPARDPARADLYVRLDALLARVDGLAAENRSFREGLDGIVAQRLEGTRAILATEQEALAAYEGALADIDTRAAGLRDIATMDALTRVRHDLSRTVLRADVGIVDTAFARKQAETEHIGQLQRARSAELTELTQAYADLTKDELP